MKHNLLGQVQRNLQIFWVGLYKQEDLQEEKSDLQNYKSSKSI